jgi:hypothetical protein
MASMPNLEVQVCVIDEHHILETIRELRELIDALAARVSLLESLAIDTVQDEGKRIIV